MKTVVLIVSICLFGTQPSASLAQAKNDTRAKQLESEKKKLDRTQSPPNRAKSLMTIAEITLSYVSEEANENDFFKMNSFLVQYRQAVKDARDTMMGSGLDPQKKSGGYKTVEIALRKQLRMLQDVGRQLPIEEREPVNETIDVVSKTRVEFMHALFGAPSSK
jgi:hypothetical protein